MDYVLHNLAKYGGGWQSNGLHGAENGLPAFADPALLPAPSTTGLSCDDEHGDGIDNGQIGKPCNVIQNPIRLNVKIVLIVLVKNSGPVEWAGQMAVKQDFST